MANPYEKHYRSKQAHNGERTCFKLPFFYRGFIQKVIIKQVGPADSLVNFKVNIYNSERPCVNASLSSGTQDPDGDNPDGYYESDPELYKVFDTFVGNAGEAAKYIETTGRAYLNMDGDISVPQRFIYVEIFPDDDVSLGSSAWDIAIGGYVEDPV